MPTGSDAVQSFTVAGQTAFHKHTYTHSHIHINTHTHTHKHTYTHTHIPLTHTTRTLTLTHTHTHHTLTYCSHTPHTHTTPVIVKANLGNLRFMGIEIFSIVCGIRMFMPLYIKPTLNLNTASINPYIYSFKNCCKIFLYFTHFYRSLFLALTFTN